MAYELGIGDPRFLEGISSVAGSRSGTILVVDDSVNILGLAKRLLQMAGYAVLTAADGEEGLRCYEEHQSDIVLLLTDVNMPHMNGLELVDRVLTLDSRMPILLLSGEARGSYRD